MRTVPLVFRYDVLLRYDVTKQGKTHHKGTLQDQQSKGRPMPYPSQDAADAIKSVSHEVAGYHTEASELDRLIIAATARLLHLQELLRNAEARLHRLDIVNAENRSTATTFEG